MGKAKPAPGFFENWCSCFDGRNQKTLKGPKQLDNTQGLAPLPMKNRSLKNVEDIRKGNSINSMSTTEEIEFKAKRSENRQDKAQKRKERQAARAKERAEQDMLNGPMGDQIKKELMAEAKKNMTPGWEDEDVIQSAGQQELFEGPEDTMGKSESRIGGFESVVTLEVPSNTNVGASGMKKKNKKK